MNKIALMGSGNILFCDEGIGLYMAKYLKTNYTFTPSLDFIDGGTVGLDALDILTSYEKVLILNTASIGECATVHCFDGKGYLAQTQMKKTVHEHMLVELLQSALLADLPMPVTILSITPFDIISVKIGLSQPLISYFPHYLKSVLDLLETLGIHAQPVALLRPLSKIIEAFSHALPEGYL